MRWVLSGVAAAAIAVAASGAARADEVRVTDGASDRPHALYLELFGRGGLYSVGYDLQLRDWLGVGGAVAWYQLDDERVLSLAPQVNFYPRWRGRHRWLVQTGASLMRTSVRSPVPEWDGVAQTGVGGLAASGYEYRGRMLVRGVLGAAAGRGGVEPWAGVSLGVAF
jgi:hypothetical protein